VRFRESKRESVVHKSVVQEFVVHESVVQESVVHEAEKESTSG
jgi:hypothetical protein